MKKCFVYQSNSNMGNITRYNLLHVVFGWVIIWVSSVVRSFINIFLIWPGNVTCCANTPHTCSMGYSGLSRLRLCPDRICFLVEKKPLMDDGQHRQHRIGFESIWSVFLRYRIAGKVALIRLFYLTGQIGKFINCLIAT